MCASYFILNCTDETQVFEMAICRTKIYCNFGTFIFIITGSTPPSGGLLVPRVFTSPVAQYFGTVPKKPLLF
jgi:hypothetical protein